MQQARMRPTILVVDDNQDICLLLKEYLEENGCNVVFTTNGANTLDYIVKFSPSLIILDLLMPNFDGLQVLRTLQDIQLKIPTLIISATGRIQDIIEAHRLGAVDFITKPMDDLEQVKNLIDKYLLQNKKIQEQNKYLKELEKLLHKRTQDVEESKITLSTVLKSVDEEKNSIKESVALNIEKNILPIISTLYQNHRINKDEFVLLEKHLSFLTDEYYKKLVNLKYNLTPTEIEICQLVRAGHSGKQIANMLSISYLTVSAHKKNIRKKLRINNTKENLRSYLCSIL